MTYWDRKRQREYQKEYARKKRKLLLEGRVCAFCGGTDRLGIVWAAEGDAPKKKISSTTTLAYFEKRLAEGYSIACHTHVLSVRKKKKLTAPHGSWGMYKRGCKCPLCKEKKSSSRKLETLRKKIRMLPKEERLKVARERLKKLGFEVK